MRFFLYKIWCGEGSPRSAPSRQISSLWLYKCGFTGPKIVKNVIFLYKFAPKEKFKGATEKVGYKCTSCNYKPHLYNDTVIVLKITLLHSVSVITKFVIPKRDKQTKNITLFCLQPAPTHDPNHTWHGDRWGLSHFCTLLTFFIPSLVSPLGAIENLRENAPTVGKC